MAKIIQEEIKIVFSKLAKDSDETLAVLAPSHLDVLLQAAESIVDDKTVIVEIVE